MDQKKNQGQQSEHPRGQGHQTHDEEGQHVPSSGKDNREKGRGGHGERNLGGGISNRDMDRELEEQEELPDRGSRQSER